MMMMVMMMTVMAMMVSGGDCDGQPFLYFSIVHMRDPSDHF